MDSSPRSVRKSGIRPLTSGDADDQAPTWSADGNRLLFLRTIGASREIAIVDLAETPVQTVPTAGRLPIGLPDWSPDGSAIVFAATEPATPTMDISSTTQWGREQADR
jgi:Tol biopolymer transport system component